MKSDVDFLITGVINEYEVFRAIIALGASYHSEITIWGNFSESVSRELVHYEMRSSPIRKRIFQEHSYQISPDDVEVFIKICRKMNLKKLAWGMTLNNESFVLARSFDDISLCYNQLIASKTIYDLLTELQKKNAITSFEIIEDVI